jgi:outer membrane immunogenic protein
MPRVPGVKKYLCIAVVSAVLFSGDAAQARDPILSPSQIWSGFYVGVHGGYLRADQEIALDSDPTVTGNPGAAFGGLQIGYWAPLSMNWLYGFEADLSFARGDLDGASGVGTQFERFGTARTRLGYAHGPWLFFASGGFAWARVANDNIPSTPINTKHSFIGWSGAAGIEYALSLRWSARAEYIFAGFDKNFEDLFGLTVRPDVSFGAVRLGLNYRLGGLHDAAPRAAPRGATFNWSGSYIGLHGGYATGQQAMTYSTFIVPFYPKGKFGGLQGGFNWHFASNVVLGIESDISFGKIEGDYLSGCCVVKIDRFGTVRLRTGYAFNNLLIYGTGGLAWAKTDNNYLNGMGYSDRPLVGAAFGAGVEYALSPLWSVKGEYLRVNFSPNRTEHVASTVYDESGHYNIYRIGLNYRASLFEILAGR